MGQNICGKKRQCALKTIPCRQTVGGLAIGGMGLGHGLQNGGIPIKGQIVKGLGRQGQGIAVMGQQGTPQPAQGSFLILPHHQGMQQQIRRA